MSCTQSNNRYVFYGQENNAIEIYNAYEKTHDGLDHYTETCGPTSLWNGCNAMGKILVSKLRIADEIFCWLNEKENWPQLAPWTNDNGDIVKPGDVPNNQVQAWFPIALKMLYGVDTNYHVGLRFDDVVNIIDSGNAVQLARRVGHFVVAVDYDKNTDALVYWDSFHLFIGNNGSLTDDGTGGFRRGVKRDDFPAFCYSRFVELLP